MEGENYSAAESRLQKWDSQTIFREYLLLLGHKRELGLESVHNFPKTIELSREWHEKLNRMRKATKEDGLERGVSIGYREDRQIVLPDEVAVGEAKQVPREVQIEERRRAKERHGISLFIGNIHTHPIDFPISAGDLRILLLSDTRLFLQGVVTPSWNIFIFRTRETKMMERAEVPEADFYKYWMEKSGYKFPEGKTTPTRWSKFLANPWKHVFNIAREHKLVAYMGNRDEVLERKDPR